MGLVAELQFFKKELQAMNRKLDQVIALLKLLVELQTEDTDDEPEIE